VPIFKCSGHLHSKEFINFISGLIMMVALLSHGLLGPIFCEETVNSECYSSMLHNTFAPHLLATGFLLQTRRFMQDGGRAHTLNAVLDFLHDTSRLTCHLKSIS
jgi:hypothetical protein